jgi:hypothetical protein
VSDCYIYYRVAAEHEQAARRALHTMLAELEASARIVGNAYCKTGEPLLWMEVYTAVADPDALVDLLTRLAERHGLINCLAENQRRHVEHFLPLDSQ